MNECIEWNWRKDGTLTKENKVKFDPNYELISTWDCDANVWIDKQRFTCRRANERMSAEGLYLLSLFKSPTIVVRLVCLFAKAIIDPIFITCSASLMFELSTVRCWFDGFYRYVILVLNNCSFAMAHSNVFHSSILKMVTRYFIDLRRHLTNNEFEHFNVAVWIWTMNIFNLTHSRESSMKVMMIFAFSRNYFIFIALIVNHQLVLSYAYISSNKQWLLHKCGSKSMTNLIITLSTKI